MRALQQRRHISTGLASSQFEIELLCERAAKAVKVSGEGSTDGGGLRSGSGATRARKALPRLCVLAAKGIKVRDESSPDGSRLRSGRVLGTQLPRLCVLAAKGIKVRDESSPDGGHLCSGRVLGTQLPIIHRVLHGCRGVSDAVDGRDGAVSRRAPLPLPLARLVRQSVF